MAQAQPTTISTWFEEKVLMLLPDLYGGARALCHSPEDAEDLVAEAVARAWERLDDLRERDRFRGWLFRILRNCCLAEHRTRRSRPEHVPLVDEPQEGSNFALFDRLHQPFLLWWGSPEDEFLGRLVRADLERALEELPAAYRQAVYLADVQEFSYSEIAEALEIPLGTVRSRLARGRSLLQEQLWRHAVDAGLREPPVQPEDAESGGGADGPEGSLRARSEGDPDEHE